MLSLASGITRAAKAPKNREPIVNFVSKLGYVVSSVAILMAGLPHVVSHPVIQEVGKPWSGLLALLALLLALAAWAINALESKDDSSETAPPEAP